MNTNFLNSPSGPLGAAGQTSTSTMPQNLFNNAGGMGSRFGAGIDDFKGKMQSFGNDPMKMLAAMFGQGGMLGNLFGGDGGMLGGMFGPKGVGGIPGNLARIPQGLQQIPQGLGQAFFGGGQTNGTAGPSGAAPQGGGGFLSRFMRGGR